jgi:2-keto-3-deoxy-L-rhamnonate aldolase RhmA
MPDNSVIVPNRAKQALQAGQPVIGTMLIEIRQPAVMQLLANAGFDFVIIDNEHGAFNIETIADLSRTAKYVGLTPLVRVPEMTYPYIAQSLDAGAQGVVIPRIYHPDQVREAVQMTRYPPEGMRGSALTRGYTNFKSGVVSEIIATVNEETLLIIQIETREALESVDEIVSIPGVDAAFIGPNDLSIALGLPGQIDSPEVEAAIERTIAACQRHQVIPCIHMNDLKLAVHWARKGMRLISVGSEAGLLMWRGREVTGTMGEAFGQ